MFAYSPLFLDVIYLLLNHIFPCTDAVLNYDFFQSSTSSICCHFTVYTCMKLDYGQGECTIQTWWGGEGGASYVCCFLTRCACPQGFMQSLNNFSMPELCDALTKTQVGMCLVCCNVQIASMKRPSSATETHSNGTRWELFLSLPVCKWVPR